MSVCATCGLEIPDTTDLCAHHHRGGDAGWAANNRAMCDFLHRGRMPPRLPREQRDEPIRADAA